MELARCPFLVPAWDGGSAAIDDLEPHVPGFIDDIVLAYDSASRHLAFVDTENSQRLRARQCPLVQRMAFKIREAYSLAPALVPNACRIPLDTA